MALGALSSLNSLDLLNSFNYTRRWILDASRNHPGAKAPDPQKIHCRSHPRPTKAEDVAAPESYGRGYGTDTMPQGIVRRE